MSLPPLRTTRRRTLAVAVALGLAVAAVALGSGSGQATSSDCATTCLSMVGVANLPAADADDLLNYAYTVTNQGSDDELTSFTVSSTRQLSVNNNVTHVLVNGVTVPYADLDYLPGNDPYSTKIAVATPIAGHGGQATISFVLGAVARSATRTTLTAAAASGQSRTSSEIDTPYPTVDVAARYVGDVGIHNPSIGNAHGIRMDVPVFSYGTGETPKVRFTFVLGSGWQATATPGYPVVSCTSAGTTWTCDQQAPLDNERSDQMITLVPAETAGINVVRNVHVYVDPIGAIDQVPSNNNVTLGVENTGTADTGRTVSVASTKLTVGGKTTVTVVVANRGPQTTNGLQVLVLHDGNHTTDHVVLSSGTGSGGFTGYYGIDGSAGYQWAPPAIVPGRSYTATFTLTGKAKGVGYVSVTTHAVTYDPGTEGVAVKSPPITVS